MIVPGKKRAPIDPNYAPIAESLVRAHAQQQVAAATDTSVCMLKQDGTSCYNSVNASRNMDVTWYGMAPAGPITEVHFFLPYIWS